MKTLVFAVVLFAIRNVLSAVDNKAVESSELKEQSVFDCLDKLSAPVSGKDAMERLSLPEWKILADAGKNIYPVLLKQFDAATTNQRRAVIINVLGSSSDPKDNEIEHIAAYSAKHPEFFRDHLCATISLGLFAQAKRERAQQLIFPALWLDDDYIVARSLELLPRLADSTTLAELDRWITKRKTRAISDDPLLRIATLVRAEMRKALSTKSK